MNPEKFLSDYFDRYRTSIFDEKSMAMIMEMASITREAGKKRKKIIFCGNGGSAAIASHCVVDFTKQAGIRSVNFNEPGVMSAFANDYGFEHWMAKAVEFYAEEGDVAVLISTSGKSKNIINAARSCRKLDVKVITLTGFEENNPLRAEGHLNFWVNSRAYNIVENTHQIWLLAVCDLIIGKAEYSVS